MSTEETLYGKVVDYVHKERPTFLEMYMDIRKASKESLEGLVWFLIGRMTSTEKGRKDK